MGSATALWSRIKSQERPSCCDISVCPNTSPSKLIKNHRRMKIQIALASHLPAEDPQREGQFRMFEQHAHGSGVMFSLAL